MSLLRNAGAPRGGGTDSPAARALWLLNVLLDLDLADPERGDEGSSGNPALLVESGMDSVTSFTVLMPPNPAIGSSTK